MKLYCLVLILLVSLCSGTVKAQSGYDTPADAPIINTYTPIDWGAVKNIRDMNIQVMRKKVMNAYDAYRYYPNIISDGWHNVVSVMSNAIIPHKAFVESNRIIKVILQDEIEKTDITILNGRCVMPNLIIYFYEDIEAYNK